MIPLRNTVNDIISDAMEDAGLLQEGDTPTGEQYVKYTRRLQDLLNMYQTMGLKLWLLQDLPITLVAGVATYSLSPTGSVVMNKPSRAIQGYFLDASGNRVPLRPMGWEEYLRLSQVTQQGALNAFFVDKQATSLNVTFWLVPNAIAAAGTAHLLLQTQVSHPISLTDSTSFPEEWRIALRWGLADDICTGQSGAIMQRCEQRATQFRMALEDWDVEDAPTRFSPNLQGGGGSFL